MTLPFLWRVERDYPPLNLAKNYSVFNGSLQYLENPLSNVSSLSANLSQPFFFFLLTQPYVVFHCVGYLSQVPGNATVQILLSITDVETTRMLFSTSRLTFVLVGVLLSVVHSMASEDSTFFADVTSASTIEGDSSVQVTEIEGPPPSGITSCSFRRFRNNLRSLIDFSSVFPYIYIVLFIFNLIFNPFLILWLAISPLTFNIIGSTAMCFAFPVSIVDVSAAFSNAFPYY